MHDVQKPNSNWKKVLNHFNSSLIAVNNINNILFNIIGRFWLNYFIYFSKVRRESRSKEVIFFDINVSTWQKAILFEIWNRKYFESFFFYIEDRISSGDTVRPLLVRYRSKKKMLKPRLYKLNEINYSTWTFLDGDRRKRFSFQEIHCLWFRFFYFISYKLIFGLFCFYPLFNFLFFLIS